jgi:hypothetical protein
MCSYIFSNYSDGKRNKVDSSSSKGGPKMYEIADGVSTSRAVFSHTGTYYFIKNYIKLSILSD